MGQKRQYFVCKCGAWTWASKALQSNKDLSKASSRLRVLVNKKIKLLESIEEAKESLRLQLQELQETTEKIHDAETAVEKAKLELTKAVEPPPGVKDVPDTPEPMDVEELVTREPNWESLLVQERLAECTGLSSIREVQGNHTMHDQVPDETSPEAAQVVQASGTKVLPSKYPARRHRTKASRSSIPQLTHAATVLRQAGADEPRLQEAAVELAEWVESSELPEETLEHQLAWQILEHCAGTPGPLDLHTLAAFADIANEAQVVGPARPLVLAVANITHWRPEILHWYHHTGADCLLAQETHLSQAQEAKAKATLVEAGLHSFWAGATATNSTKGGLVVATPWQAHPRLIQSFTVDGCGLIAVELPRVQWRLALVTVYLQTAKGLQAEPNATIMAALLALLQRLPNWVAAGDWNVDLQQFAATNIPVVARGEVIGSPAAALPSGNTLDYVLASRSVAGLVSLQVDKAVPFGPHYCLRLELDLAHGLLNLPTLKGFSGPHGAFPVPLAPTPPPSAPPAEGYEIEEASLDCGHVPITTPVTGCGLEPWTPAEAVPAVNIGFEELKQRARLQARELQPLDATTVERYMRKTPLKASGPDGWTPQMARALTSEQCDHLATLFRRAELSGEFPQQWSATLVILLAKNPEVERPIALMHTMLKCWMKLRLPNCGGPE
eukprot:s720_g42.t1